MRTSFYHFFLWDRVLWKFRDQVLSVRGWVPPHALVKDGGGCIWAESQSVSSWVSEVMGAREWVSQGRFSSNIFCRTLWFIYGVQSSSLKVSLLIWMFMHLKISSTSKIQSVFYKTRLYIYIRFCGKDIIASVTKIEYNRGILRRWHNVPNALSWCSVLSDFMDLIGY